MRVHATIAALVDKVENDTRINAAETNQIKCLVETITSYLDTSREKTAQDTTPVQIEDSYNKHISDIWISISNDDTIKASNKRVILYAITQLQQSLWRY